MLAALGAVIGSANHRTLRRFHSKWRLYTIFHKPIMRPVRFKAFMVIAIMLLPLVPIIAGGCSQPAFYPETPASSGQNGLALGSDGTATVTGTVMENYLGCRVDLPCYLQLRAGTKEGRIIYHPGEGESHLNKSAYAEGGKAKKGDRVKAYGQYRKQGTREVVETYSSDSFYISILSN